MPVEDRDQGLVKSHGVAETVQDMKAMILQRPLSGSFSIGPGFFNYSWGLIKPFEGEENPVCSGDTDATQMGWHEMAVVGLDTTEEPKRMTVSTEKVTWARHKEQADYDNGCQAPEYEYPAYPDFCLEDETVEEQVEMEAGSFWKVQNSWGLGWGHDGYAYVKVTDGVGTCNMNEWGGTWVTTKHE